LGLGKPRGAYVRNVDPGGPAAIGGIESGDVILSFNGREIAKSTDLPRLVGETKPGTSATVQVWSKGATRALSVTVGNSESNQAAAKKTDAPTTNGAGSNVLGVAVTELSDAKKKELSVKGGIEVTGLGDGALARAGIRPGDVIIRIGDADITGVKQFEGLVKGLDANKAVPVFIRRADSTLVIPVRPK
jgi:serine protease Do